MKFCTMYFLPFLYAKCFFPEYDPAMSACSRMRGIDPVLAKEARWERGLTHCTG